jgi:hypothetical protein
MFVAKSAASAATKAEKEAAQAALESNAGDQ